MLVNILHLYRTYFPDPPGGLQEAIRQICLATQTHSVTSTIFTLSRSPIPSVLKPNEGRVVRARSWYAPASCDFGLKDSFVKFNDKAKAADILLFHFPCPFVDLLGLLPGAKGKPKVLTYHSDIVRQKLLASLYYPLMQHTLRSADVVVATSLNYATSSHAFQQIIDPAKVRIIPLGLKDRANSVQHVLSNNNLILDRLGLTKGKFVLSLCVLRYYKGLHTLIQAAAVIPFPVVIAGSGPEESNLQRLVEDLGITNVIFTGQVTEAEKDALMSECTLFVLPSHLRSEAFGMVLIEASMFSKPMVTCEIGSGMSYVNQDGVTGFVVPPEAPKHLAQAINRLLENHALVEKMGKAARARYLELFSGEILGKAYAKLYKEVLTSRIS